MDNYSITTSLGSIAGDSYNYLNDLFSNKAVVIIILIIGVSYLILFLSLGGSSTSTTNSQMGSSQGMNFFGVIVMLIFVILILINGFQYLFGIDIVAKLKNVISGTPEIEINVDTQRLQEMIPEAQAPETLLKPQVFNIPENVYTYEDAKAICKAYDARLATYEEMEETYEGGGEWCNYGWSNDQMALFPTQTKTWDKLQKIKGHENDCGRPGINGGYIDNENVRFGVNCFGYKPKMTNDEMLMMSETPLYPKTQEEIDFERRVDFWKKQIPDIIVAPFSHNRWSVI